MAVARYYRLPANVSYKLPDNLTLEDGAMVSTCLIVSISLAI
jgi:hypothetical protein